MTHSGKKDGFVTFIHYHDSFIMGLFSREKKEYEVKHIFRLKFNIKTPQILYLPLP